MATRFSKANNPHYPRPPDYPDLTEEGKRLARLNAVMLQDTPEDLVYAWEAFREQYLMPPDAYWFKKYKKSPPGHYQMIYDIGQWSQNAEGAPRSFAKSTICNEAVLLLSLTRPGFASSIVRATIAKSRKNMGKIRRQFNYNKYIIQDFGELMPTRGSRTWTTEMLELPNGSTIESASVQSALRGDRPDFILIDDPEYDEDLEKEGKGQQLLEDFETLLFSTVLNMLDDGSGIFWIGTLISRRHYIWHMCRGGDSRFDYWNRRVLPILLPDGTSVWPEKWTLQAIEDRRMRIGESSFQAEYMNNPGAGSERIFVVHPELNTYSVDGCPQKEALPLASSAPIRWAEGFVDDDRKEYKFKEEPFGEFASRLYRMTLMDFAPTVRDTSDYSCILTIGFERTDALWILDGWLGKAREDELVRILWDQAFRWRSRIIGVEAVAFQKHLADRAAHDLAIMSRGTGYLPRVWPIRYPGRDSKPQRIRGLEWRYRMHRIRYPAHRRREFWVSQLYYQTENFTEDLTLLPNDDVIDTVAMHQYVVRGAGGKRARQTDAIKTPADYLREGILFEEKTGIPYLTSIPSDRITDDLIIALMKRRMGAQQQKEDPQPWIATL